MEILITGESFQIPIMNPGCPIKTQEIELLNYPSTVRETLRELLHHENTKNFEAVIVIPQVMEEDEPSKFRVFSYETERNDGSTHWELCTQKIKEPINLLHCVPKKITGSIFIEQYTDETRTKVREDSPYKYRPNFFKIYLDGSSLISKDKPNPNIPVIDKREHLKP